jgi:hypothetical protein
VTRPEQTETVDKAHASLRGYWSYRPLLPACIRRGRSPISPQSLFDLPRDPPFRGSREGRDRTISFQQTSAFQGQATRATIMLRIIIIAIALLIDSAITAEAGTSGCSQLSDLSATRLRWAAVREGRVDPSHSEESCRSYRSNFL